MSPPHVIFIVESGEAKSMCWDSPWVHPAEAPISLIITLWCVSEKLMIPECCTDIQGWFFICLIDFDLDSALGYVICAKNARGFVALRFISVIWLQIDWFWCCHAIAWLSQRNLSNHEAYRWNGLAVWTLLEVLSIYYESGDVISVKVQSPTSILPDCHLKRCLLSISIYNKLCP